MLQLRGELKDLIRNLRNVQKAISRLKAAGADDSVIRIVMILMGYGNVAPEELLAASTPKDVAEIISRAGKRLDN